MATSNDGGITSSQPPRTPTSNVHSDNISQRQSRSSTNSSGRLRSASLKFLESSPPSGMWHATGNALAQAPTPMEIRRGEYGNNGWDGELQRRNSIISQDGTQRLSRQTSAQTPVALVRTRTNPLKAHPEADDEGSSTVRSGGSVAADREPFAMRPQATADKTGPADMSDDDDPFSMFVGRGRIDSQSYAPKAKTAANQVEAVKSDTATDGDDDSDSLDDLDPRPKKRRSALPKKFLDPTGDDIPQPGEEFTNSKIAPRSLPVSPVNRVGPNEEGVYPNGYKFPPKHTRGQATKIGLKAFWKFTITPLGFLIVLYGLNVVAWGGMLFLLLIGGGQQFMCYVPNEPGVKDCNNLYAPRRIWIEIDSQILNALFCVTGFGLIPWRFRDLYYLLQFRIRHKKYALRKLAGIHRSWFRLPGSEDLDTSFNTSSFDPQNNPAIPLPPSKTPDPPLTGFRAPATKLWKLDYVIWAYVLNTFLQAVLSGFMWGLNRFDRPSWSTGTFVAMASIVAALGGLMCFQEGKRIKAVEGIPVKEEELLRDVEKQVIEGETGKKGLQEKRQAS